MVVQRPLAKKWLWQGPGGVQRWQCPGRGSRGCTWVHPAMGGVQRQKSDKLQAQLWDYLTTPSLCTRTGTCRPHPPRPTSKQFCPWPDIPDLHCLPKLPWGPEPHKRALQATQSGWAPSNSFVQYLANRDFREEHTPAFQLCSGAQAPHCDVTRLLSTLITVSSKTYKV